jgi:CO/xanthine dehydrogenase FAD-binding subunit
MSSVLVGELAMAGLERYTAPVSFEEVLRAAAAKGVALLAGGTDLVPRWRKGLAAEPEAVVDLKRVGSLRGISRSNGEIRIGACASLSELAEDTVIRETAPVLADAADRVACPQIRNRATIGGNLCNASPAADTAVPLILLDAVVELASWQGDSARVRELPITAFILGPGATAIAPGEVMTCIRFKPQAKDVLAAWEKFGTRRAMEIAVASVGVACTVEGGAVARARVGYGSVAPIPLRGRKAEVELLGRPLSTDVVAACVTAAREEIAPISDVRASEGYRREVVGVMLGRMLERVKQHAER